ncbi:hypothetical protein K6959_09060 [Bacillus aquiflavi]|uniref:hypothetical protein n=1 Tax=Bacillus aquiflavi TaxID=2672567 RepID=UPI001CA8703D|nr:hypothetical protein [Bacillus aquiflavi]UAC49891.1 hypothetical protein K6959_09060 [Bacillus aquiflavi]
MKKWIIVGLIIVFFNDAAAGKCLEVNKLTSNISYQIELLSWEEVNKLLPKKSIFTVIDVDSGMKFRVQRRAGSQHADVQPLTATDTKIMKKIYNGKWSWKRRAIIVMHNDRWIAASMHGMPHGAGALNNQFPGHFCIHFLGSTTHQSDNIDLAHKLMVLKAAGVLEEFLMNAKLEELIHCFITGLKQHDQRITSFVSTEQLNWREIFHLIENVTLLNVKKNNLMLMINCFYRFL